MIGMSIVIMVPTNLYNASALFMPLSSQLLLLPCHGFAISPSHRPIKQLDYVRDFSVGQLRNGFDGTVIF
jgi:hypothetical protein